MHWFDVLRNSIWLAPRAKSFELAGMELVELRKVGEVLFSLACWYTLLQYVPYAVVVVALFVVGCCAGTWKFLVWCHDQAVLYRNSVASASSVSDDTRYCIQLQSPRCREQSQPSRGDLVYTSHVMV